ncbi:MAG: GGDEF domain-containing protein [Deltaproteobacteria bacterium]|nr:GGDEF domain-containing protein [Deltaproteobacteria bacterium]
MSSGSDDGNDWQARTHVIRYSPATGKPKDNGNDCLVIIYSRDVNQLGRRFVLDSKGAVSTVGRGADNAVVLDSETCSRKHASFERKGEVWWITDNESTNGTYVNDESVRSNALRRGDLIKIGDTIFKYLSGSDVEAEFIQTIGELMVTDGLTRAHNRRYLTDHLETELQRSRRYRRPLTLIMFDLDKFKGINDNYGHLAGDHVLKETASLVKQHLAEGMVFARYGGEEFALLLPETPLEKAVDLAEKIRVGIFEHVFMFEGMRLPVSMSMGVAIAGEHMHTAEEFIKAADEKLYKAKHAGRNCVRY